MQRRPEPELMDDVAQAAAYAAADFSAPHEHFIELFRQNFPGLQLSGHVLDLGCGPGDITLRFSRAFPDCTLHGVDGAGAMLEHGRRALRQSGLNERIQLIHGTLPAATLPLTRYDALISNSLLHHLGEPQVLWQSIRRYARSGAPIFVMDLLRPPSEDAARDLVGLYSADEPEILQRDFFNSLCAAFRPEEVRAQLQQAGLDLSLEVVSDRHFIVYGRAA